MFSVRIIWGADGQDATTYEFPTEKELDAFLTGVEAGVGWLEYEVVE